MKITIIKDAAIAETEITVRCTDMTEELTEILSHISLIDHNCAGKANGETFFIPMKDILYFESVDEKVFFYTANETYESTAKLCQIEERLTGTLFARISKTVIANLKKMRSIKSAEHSRLMATMTHGEKLVVSRRYVSEIKEKLGV